MGLSMPEELANLLGYAVAMVLYGIFLSLFISVIRPIWRRREQIPVVVCVTLVLFLVTSVSVALDTVHVYNGFIRFRDVPGTVPYFSYVWTPIRPLIQLFFAAGSITSEILLSWRMYVIWGRNRKVLILPGICLTIAVVIAATVTGLTFHLETVLYEEHHQAFVAAGMLSSAVSLVINFTATTMIVGKLWWVSRSEAVPPPIQCIYNGIIFTLIESGAIYTIPLTIWTFWNLAPGGAGEGTTSFLMYIMVMLASISPMLIVSHVNTYPRNPDDFISCNTARFGETGSRKFSVSKGTRIGKKTSYGDFELAFPTSLSSSSSSSETRVEEGTRRTMINRRLSQPPAPGLGARAYYDDEEDYLNVDTRVGVAKSKEADLEVKEVVVEEYDVSLPPLPRPESLRMSRCL